VRASHATGEAVTVWMPPWLPFGARAAAYVVSVLDDLGFRARSRIVRGANARDPFTVEDRIGLQIGFNGWYPDYASPSGDILGGLTCSSYKRDSAGNENLAEFCDPAIDRDIARAQSLQHPDPEAASSLWRRIDTEITDQAPWVSFANGVVVDVKSRRLGNYEYSPQWGVLLDQLWVR
jgi:peptide/nickel transport system substrate-binding protein